MQIKVAGGDKWQDYIKKHFLQMKKTNVKVGILDGATYSQDHNQYFAAEKKFKNGNSRRVRKKRKEARKILPKIVEVAFWNEFGTKKSPARPFLRNTFNAKEQEWRQELTKLLKVMPMEQALDQLGGIMVADVVETIKQGISPELSDFTKNQRWANKIAGTTPLMASREMITAISHQVEEG